MDQQQLSSAGVLPAANGDALATAPPSACRPLSQASDEGLLKTNVKCPALAWTPSFRLDPGVSRSDPSNTRYWSHELYRGPQRQPVQVLYAKTKAESEEIACKFLNEKILGFDTEWVPGIADNSPAPLGYRISLIQIASEDKIALFHIARHSGNTPDELIATNLRTIIESADITKAGVMIMAADVSRLRKWFNLEPRAIFELSHLHNLVTYGATDPTKCTKKPYKLEEHVKTHLGSRLFKGDVRMSFSSSSLSREQQKYAAADAYAGFMLYHGMNAKRAAMSPEPPMPIHADVYVKGEPLRLQTGNNSNESITALEFFLPSKEPATDGPATEHGLEGTEQTKGTFENRTTRNRNKSKPSEQKLPNGCIDTKLSDQLFELLQAHRAAEAAKRGCPCFAIASNTVLREISRQAPRRQDALLQVRGIGSKKAAEYGSAWLSIIRDTVKDPARRDSPEVQPDILGPANISLRQSMDQSTDNRSTIVCEPRETHEHHALVASETAPPAPIALHTGLSFSMEQVDLLEHGADTEHLEVVGISLASSSATETFPNASRPSTSRRKRKSSEEFARTAG